MFDKPTAGGEDTGKVRVDFSANIMYNGNILGILAEVPNGERPILLKEREVE